MQKTPITLPIAPSKVAALLQFGLALGLCSLCYWVLSGWGLGLWISSGVTLLAGFLLWRAYYAQASGVLYLAKRDDHLYGHWQQPYGELSDELVVRCDYLGPWLIGLWVGPERLWLWPDSLPRHSHRMLRRLCHRAGR
ncbi:protein YgfX [Vreelandella zhanjiangensis]|uniref:protein YgfX n=1 Tax=Vreelandella zhanjiangensis TaxID=1121960 RepID=UPI00402A9559